MQSRGEVRPLRFSREREVDPLVCSAATPWAGVQFEVHRVGEVHEIGESGPLSGEYGLMIVARGEYDTTVRSSQGDHCFHSRAGAIRVLSGDERPHVLSMRGRAEVVAIHLTPDWLRYLPVDITKLGRHAPLSGGRTICSLVSAVREEVTTGCGSGRLYAESLSLSLLSYAFSRLPAPEQVERTGLSASEQEKLRRYIHEHLDRNIGLGCLAAVIGLGPRRFSARFREAFGITPHRYVTELRVREGARLLATGRYDIAEIALRVGFCSQSHFTTAFRRAYGLTPSRYASGKRTIVQV
jgi:AraC family transcriptional regulator